MGNLTVSVSVLNFDLEENQGQLLVAGEGSLLYRLDGNSLNIQGVSSCAILQTWVITDSQTHTFHDVGSGPHTVSVELVNNNGAALTPRILVTMTVVCFPLPFVPSIVVVHAARSNAINSES